MMSFQTWCMAIRPMAPFYTPWHGDLGHPPAHHRDSSVGHTDSAQIADQQQHALLRHHETNYHYYYYFLLFFIPLGV